MYLVGPLFTFCCSHSSQSDAELHSTFVSADSKSDCLKIEDEICRCKIEQVF